jgi:Zn-dependent protease
MIAVIVPSIILHEVSHGWAAYRFGDDTAKRAGRLTLNPVPHIDPFGTIILPILMAAVGFGIFGYARPVPVNPRRMRHPRNDALWTALAGPATNIIISVIAALVLRQMHPEGLLVASDGDLIGASLVTEIVLWVGLLNVLLAVFNLIPLPPLDGSAVVERFLPARYWRQYLIVRKYSMFVLIGIILLAPQVFSGILGAAVRQWAKLL